MKLSACLAVLFALGCKSDEEKIVDAHKSKLKVQFERIAALAPKVEKEPKLTADTWPVAGVKFSDNIYTDPSGNTLLAWSHQLVDACTNDNVTFAKDNTGTDWIILSNTIVSTAIGALALPKCALDGKMERAAGMSVKQVEYLVATKYLLVLRPHDKQAPSLDAAEVSASTDAYLKGDKSKEVKHFVPGRIAGDALLYELESGKLLGGFVFDANSSDVVEVGASYDNLRFDVGKNLEKLLIAKMGK